MAESSALANARVIALVIALRRSDHSKLDWNMALRKAMLTVVCLIAFPNDSDAYGLCDAPRTPSFYETKPIKPFKPSCINEFSGGHTCDSATVDRYNSEVEIYNSQLRAYKSSAELYVMELNTYLKKAKEYAQCEADNL
ncbi:MAG: hypothetical protein ACR650_03970 [Methylocystis sp.]